MYANALPMTFDPACKLHAKKSLIGKSDRNGCSWLVYYLKNSDRDLATWDNQLQKNNILPHAKFYYVFVNFEMFLQHNYSLLLDNSNYTLDCEFADGDVGHLHS